MEGGQDMVDQTHRLVRLWVQKWLEGRKLFFTTCLRISKPCLVASYLILTTIHELVLFTSFCRWGNQDSERPSDLPQIKKLIQSGASIWVQGFLNPKLPFFLLYIPGRLEGWGNGRLKMRLRYQRANGYDLYPLSHLRAFSSLRSQTSRDLCWSQQHMGWGRNGQDKSRRVQGGVRVLGISWISSPPKASFPLVLIPRSSMQYQV